MNKNYFIYTIYGLSGLFLLMVFSVFIILPIFSIKEIKIDSAVAFTRDIREITGLNRHSSYLFLSSDELESRVMKEPLVRKVFVEKEFPNTLSITVFGRKALAVAYVEREGAFTPLCFDENGVVFQIGDEVTDVDLPVISGDLDFSEVNKGGALPEVLIPLLKSLKELRATYPEHYNSISEIVVYKRGNMSFDLTLYFNFSPIKAMIRDVIVASEIKNIVVVLSLLERESVNVEFVDFREEEIVYSERS